LSEQSCFAFLEREEFSSAERADRPLYLLSLLFDGTGGSFTGVNLTECEVNTHPHLMPWLRMSRAVTQLLRGLPKGAQGERYPVQINKEVFERSVDVCLYC